MNLGTRNLSCASDAVISTLNEVCLAYKGSKLSDVLSLIPYAAPVSAWLTGHATDIQIRRIETLLVGLEKRLGSLESLGKARLDDETLHDLVLMTLEASIKARDQRKIAWLANGLAQGVRGDIDVDETQAAIDIIAGLQDVDIHLLLSTVTSAEGVGDAKPMRVFQVPDIPDVEEHADKEVPSASHWLPEVPLPLLLNAASRLHARGLLKDTAMGKRTGSPRPLWAPSHLADWLVENIMSE
ncbi:hypothetical protein ACFO0E_05390 [Chromohalobacter beijerinckii]|uniref:Uncharacterized protein n=1 Tax=Chromohalobacter beijerinckii TaxID=86179 RepID=A0ABV8XCJ1_9GAMM|nr:hypothetical protein [Chromohalobacter beijerinckii]MCK0765360.1 hypothetical protein [Chromohalobacter beijerinckii]